MSQISLRPRRCGRASGASRFGTCLRSRIKKTAASFAVYENIRPRPTTDRTAPAVISPRRNRASLAIQDVFGNYIAGFGFRHSLKMSGMNDVIRTGLRMALGCALLIIASDPSDALAQSRDTDARTGGPRLSFLSEPRSEEQRPDEEMPRATLEDDNKSFDGAWTFASAGCRHTGSLVAVIVDGKIVARGGSGQVDPEKITAGAVSALVIVGWIVVLAIVFLTVR
jgi:hypothetical protein